LNILFIAKNVTLAGRTGDAVHARELARELGRIGHNVFVVARDLQGVPADTYREFQKPLDMLRSEDNVHIRLPRGRGKLSNPLVRDYHTLRKSILILRHYKIDLIYSRSFNAYLEGFLSAFYQIPLVLEINGFELEEREALMGRKQYPGKNLIKASSNMFFQRASHIITVTKKIKIRLNDEFKVPLSKMTVVSNGVNPQLFSPSRKAQNELRNSLKIPENASVISFIGGFDPWHGVELLARSAKKVLAAKPDAHFLMVGDGAMRNKIQGMVARSGIKDKFTFTGKVPHELVPQYINASDICVIPFPEKNTHLTDSSPIKLYEYMACGKPVLATRVGGVSEIIKASGGGKMVAPESTEAMAIGLIELLNDRKTMRRKGSRGRKYIVKHCTWRKTAEKVSQICEKVIENGNS
jgi:glycosyltransferase involved in cell wall biosynthesis